MYCAAQGLRNRRWLVCAAALAGAFGLASIAGAQTFNGGAITINDDTTATPYPSTISVSGLTLPVGVLTVRIAGLTHTNPDDIDIMLVSPSDDRIVLMSDCGGTLDVNSVNLVFDQLAAGGLPDSTQIVSGTFDPTNFGGGDTNFAGAGTATTTTLNSFTGTNGNGDWSLYVRDDTGGGTGSITSWSITIVPACQVTNTNNSGDGSLRAAILAANSNDGSDIICFNIPGDGPHVIAPTSALPTITGPTFIDGLSQPGAVCAGPGNPATVIKIVLNGSNAGGGSDGLRFNTDADGSGVQGLAIHSFGESAIVLDNTDECVIQCNYLGTDHTGTADLGNDNDGVSLINGNNGADRNLIGGGTLQTVNVSNQGLDGPPPGVVPPAGNLIVYNGDEGVMIDNGDDNFVAGNVIAFNENDGVDITGDDDSGSTGNIIGTNNDGVNDALERNVIYSNGSGGIDIRGDVDDTLIAGNLIGLLPDGVTVGGNDAEGILLRATSDGGTDRNIIGAPTAADVSPTTRNFISGNGLEGIRIDGESSTDNVIRGNSIGLDTAGNAAGNDDDGILLDFNTEDNIIELNRIFHNGGDGIDVARYLISPLGVGDNNRILNNSIDLNDELGIDLGSDMVTPNDNGDSDPGPNEFKNFPVIVERTGAGDVEGTYNGAANRRILVQLFGSPAQDPSGHGEGRTFLGETTINTDGGGDAVWSINVPAIADETKFLSTTATDIGSAMSGGDPGRGTSEFSGVLRANVPPTAVCTDTEINLESECRIFTAAQLGALVGAGSNDPDGGLITFTFCFTDSTPVPDPYEFPLGQTELTMKVTDDGLPATDTQPAQDPLTSSCRVSITVVGADCNNNGLADSCDIATGRSLDCDNSGVPDECECFWDNGLAPVVENGNHKSYVSPPQNGQLSHCRGGANNGARVADDFCLCEGQAHKINSFTGQMLTSSLNKLRRAKIQFFRDCNGQPELVPFAEFTNSVIKRTYPSIEPGFVFVEYFFDLCDEKLWLEGGCYWVSLIGVSDNVSNDQGLVDDLSFWLSATVDPDPSNVLGKGPQKASGEPMTGGDWNTCTFGPWSPIDDCCLGCVNMAFRLTGQSCKIIWDNGGPETDTGEAGGVASGADGSNRTAATADNFVLPPCADPYELCFIEAYIWTNCNPPHAFLDLYGDSECVVPPGANPPIPRRCGTGPLFRRFQGTELMVIEVLDNNNQPITRTINGQVLKLYKLLVCMPEGTGATLDAGVNYWLSAGANGTGSINARTLFAYNTEDCDGTGCGIRITEGYTRKLTPAPATPWAKVVPARDFAFRLGINGMDNPLFPIQSDMVGNVGDPTSCVADADVNGTVDADDIFFFLNSWFAGCP